MTNWTFADVWDAVAATVPDRPALAQGRRQLSWAELEARAAGLAAGLAAAGLGRQAKVAQYLYNCPAYLETVYACFKAGLVPVNINYRYTDDELVYLLEDSDTEAVVFHGSFRGHVEQIRGRLPLVRVWLWVDDGSGPRPDWALDYEEAASGTSALAAERGGDDLILLYTGGTTGAPKGVMWRQDDLFAILNRTGEVRYPEQGTVADVAAILAQPSRHAPARLLAGPPLMHGLGLFTALSVLNGGGSVVMTQSRGFDPVEVLDLIRDEHVTEMSIVGDAFAKPVLAALEAEPDRWDLSSLWLMISSGVMWSAEVKAGLLRHNPRLSLVDTLGSSEAIGVARSLAKVGQPARTAGFTLGRDAKVIADDGREVVPGSGEQGRVALRGRGPVGYYKDPDKSAATFAIIDGERWSIPGDFATVAADGTLQLLGRGSVCINTGGEKVYPEEVEEALKLHPAVADAVVVGIPDERFGESVTAVVEVRAGTAPVSDTDLVEWVRGRLATYKSPRHVVRVQSIGRSPAGKADYRRLRDEATEALSART